jgi:uncharacterized membrane protein YraQ (UPF0718 family)
MTTFKKIEMMLLFIFLCYIGIAYFYNLEAGKSMSVQALNFSANLFSLLPCAFILIGLFQVWVKREMVEKHLGKDSSWQGHFWAILLAGTTIGGLYVAFPIAVALQNKGARMAVIFSYLGAAGIVRIPMTVFEASFLGLKFSLIRLFISLPLVILSAEILGRYLEHRNYQLQELQSD